MAKSGTRAAVGRSTTAGAQETREALVKGAIEALEKDHDFLLKGGVFTQDFLDTYIEMKKGEYDAVRIRPHPYEFFMYYDV